MRKKKEQNQTETLKRFYVRQALRPEETNFRGLLVEAAWAIPKDVEDSFTSVGLPTPEPVFGLMLVDTGAGQIHMSYDVALELSLRSIGEERDVHGLGGKHVLPIYFARLIVPCVNGKGTQRLLEIHTPVRAVEHFNSSPEFQGLYNSSGELARMIGILGRTFLQLGALTYNGRKATYKIDIEDDILAKQSLVIGINGRIEG